MNDISDHIAIIGMTCRFPQARNVDEFWKNLRDGVESVSFFTREELAAQGIDSGLLDDPHYVRANAVLEEIEQFDASFFDMPPREAETTDPQHRLFLECAAELLEVSGCNPDTYAGRIGVYAGSGMSTYLMHHLASHPDLIQTVGSFQLVMGNNKDFMPTRVSYKLNLRGPSLNVSTACSTSLVAVHLACQSLLDFQSDMALAGGVGIQVPQRQGYLWQEGGITSPDGHCRPFDANAKGTVSGNGVGIVALKRLEDALAEGDTIHAVIIGSAVNNDGSAKVGYTAPGIEGQTEVIAEAQTVAKVDPETISYIEAHGTGTPLGDPVEIEALTHAFRLRTAKKGFCAIGAVKSNFGHLDEAAGVAGLIKTVLAIKHRQIPPSLHFERPNSEIDFDNSPFFVNATLSEWPADVTPRRAGISSFGIGGTNAHVIIEEAPSREASGPSRPWQVMTFSAKTASALDTATTHLGTYLKQHPTASLADIAYTLHMGRRAFPHRRMICCQTPEEATEALASLDPAKVFTEHHEPRDRPVAFIFSGQGTQYVNMGRGLYQTEPDFRKHVDRCTEMLRPHLGLDLRDLWYPDDADAIAAAHSLGQTAVAQSALFVIEYALAQLWATWGVRPQAMIGHSIGEYVAACLAGVFSLEDALALVAARGQMMQQMPPGAMLAVPLSPSDMQPLLGNELSLAAVNEPSRCVVSGPIAAMEALESHLTGQNIACRRLHTSHAFHSQMMDPLLDEFARRVRQVRLRPPDIPYLSNVTGTWITAGEATDPTYYARHLRQTVRFADGLGELLREPDRILLEVGPGRTLTTFAMRHPDKTPHQRVFSSIRHPQTDQPDAAFLLTTLGKLWLAGATIDWDGFHADEERHRIPLPTYPFERQRYWVEPSKRTVAISEPSKALPVSGKKADIADWFYIPSWRRAPLPAAEPLPPSGTWLLFADECGLGPALAQRLRDSGQEIVTVQAGTAFTSSSEDAFILNPERDDDYDQLIRELGTRGELPQQIVHLWSVTETTETGIEEAERSQYLGFHSLLFLAQALGEQGITDDLRVSVISNQMQALAGETVESPAKATLLGPVNVMGKEYPNVRCRSIDIHFSPATDTTKESRVIQPLMAELMADVSDPVIVLRDSQRWVRTYEPIRLESRQAAGFERSKDGAARRWPTPRPHGVYLITGGLGGMGLVLAEHLAKRVHARLALIGRSSFPDRGEWDQWLDTHHTDDRVTQKIRKLQAIESLGSEVFVASADVADPQQMRAVITEVRQRFGSINGVIHAAGVPDGALIPRQTREMTAAVMAPKVKGTLILDRLLADVELDFLILCSALTSILGTYGQIAYCAANAFLDAFAHVKRETFTVAVNWDAWQEVGMAVETAGGIPRISLPALPPQSKETRAVSHPLFDECVIERDDAQERYISRLNVNKHWVLHDHRIMGKATLPGTAHLELARAAFEAHAESGMIEIREVFFLSPLIVEEDEERAVHTVLTRQGDGTFEFVISSQAGPERWQEHTRGIIASFSSRQVETYDIHAIERDCHQAIIMDGLAQKPQTEFEARLRDFGPRWHNLRRLNLGDRQGLARLELPDEFADDLIAYPLHPALLDIGTGFMALHDPDYNGLPFSYKGLRIKAPLPANLYSHVRYADTEAAQSDTLRFTVTIMDEQGRGLVEIEEYALRQIRAETAIDKTFSEGRNFCLEIGSPGSLDTLTFKPALRREPGPEEVEIAVRATGLNFKEVLYALGLLPGPSGHRFKFGLECAGRIVRVGKNVRDFRKGDDVIAFAPASFSAFTTTSATSVVPKPDALSFEEAATIPSAFVTAYYALVTKGQLSEGERVLIHAAAGGVGLAAVKIAQWVGTEIFATAGNPKKRAFLRDLGIQHVMDSRSLAFADKVMEQTNGRGVDVVLNSLGGGFIPKSLVTLAPFGRFLELGIRDIQNNTPLGLRPFEKGLSYHAISVGPDIPGFNALFHEIVRYFDLGDFTPLVHRVFPITDVAAAFEHMAQARHIGKIVVSKAGQSVTDGISRHRAENGGDPMGRERRAQVGPEDGRSSVSRSPEDALQDGMLPIEGMDVFDRILAADAPQIIVSTHDFITRVEQSRTFSMDQMDRGLSSEPTHDRPALGTAYVAPRNGTERTLARIWQELLGISQIGIHDNFFDLNGDSLLAAQVISRIHNAFRMNLPMSSIFDDPTVAGLAERIERLTADQDVEEGEI